MLPIYLAEMQNDGYTGMKVAEDQGLPWAPQGSSALQTLGRFRTSVVAVLAGPSVVVAAADAELELQDMEGLGNRVEGQGTAGC